MFSRGPAKRPHNSNRLDIPIPVKTCRLGERFKSKLTGLKEIPLDLNTFRGAPVRTPSSSRLGLLHTPPTNETKRQNRVNITQEKRKCAMCQKHLRLMS